METDGDATRANEDDLTAAVEAGAVVRTFLIADVRGYTSFTQAHGDEEAGRLAARFAVLARDEAALRFAERDGVSARPIRRPDQGNSSEARRHRRGIGQVAGGEELRGAGRPGREDAP